METSPIDLQTPSNIVWNVVDDEALLLDIETGEYFSLNPVATEIWTRLSEGQSRDTIASMLGEKYEVEPEVIASDIDELLNDLSQAGLLQ